MTTYLGHDVLEIMPSFDNPISRFTRNVFRIDSHTGKTKVIDRAGVPIVAPNNFRWLMKDRDEITAYWNFLDAHLGMCIPFWVPTWRSDFILAGDVGSGVINLACRNGWYSRWLFQYHCRRYLRVFIGSNSYYRKIMLATEVSETIESIQIDVQIDEYMPQGSQLSYLTLARLVNDDPALEWHTNEIAESNLTFVEVPQEVPDPDLP